MKHLIKLSLFFLVLGSVVFVSCENDDDYNAIVGTPGEFSIAPIVVNNTVEFLWYEVVGATSYTVQIATDKEFSEQSIVAEETVTENHVIIGGLLYESTYYARLRSNTESGSSNWWVSPNAIETGESPKFKAIYINSEDIVGSTVTVKFRPEYEITDLMFIDISNIYEDEDGNEVIDTLWYSVTSTELAEGSKTVDLKILSEFDVTAWNFNSVDPNAEEYNTENFTTGIIINSGDVVVVPKHITLQQVISLINEDMEVEFVLTDGYESEINGISVEAKAITIRAENPDNKAKLTMKKSFLLSGDVDYLVFDGIEFNGDISIDSNNRPTIVGLSTQGFRLEALRFFDCEFTDFSLGIINNEVAYGLANAESGLPGVLSPSEITIDNCIAIWTENSDPLDGSTSFINTRGYTPDKDLIYTITNTTFVNMTVGVIGGQRDATGIKDWLGGTVSNCTFFGQDRVPDILFRDAAAKGLAFYNCIAIKMPGYETNTYYRPFVDSVTLKKTNNYISSDQPEASGGYGSYGWLNSNRAYSVRLTYSAEELCPNWELGDYTLDPSLTYNGQSLASMGIGDLRWSIPGTQPAE